MNRFDYLRDGLFRMACLLYAVNRWLVLPHVPAGFLHSHFNDLLLIPAALPVVLFLQRGLGWRTHNAPPDRSEIAFHLAVWSLLFEWAGPHLIRHAVGDPMDVVAYVTGGVLAGSWWNRHQLWMNRQARVRLSGVLPEPKGARKAMSSRFRRRQNRRHPPRTEPRGLGGPRSCIWAARLSPRAGGRRQRGGVQRTGAPRRTDETLPLSV